MFSNVEKERLYSTGNDDLDELLERAFCEGYEYAQREFSKKSHKEYIEREKERNKERDELLKKTTPREEAQASIMFEDTDSAGKGRYARNQMKSGLVGAAAGAIGGAVAKNKVKKLANTKKGLVIAGGAYVGNKIAKIATHKRNEKIKDEIWEKGDKEQLNYLKSKPKDKRKIEKDYIPIGWRVDKKGNYLKEKDYYPYDKSKNKSRLDDMESTVRVRRGLKKEIDKETKRREKERK